MNLICTIKKRKSGFNLSCSSAKPARKPKRKKKRTARKGKARKRATSTKRRTRRKTFSLPW